MVNLSLNSGLLYLAALPGFTGKIQGQLAMHEDKPGAIKYLDRALGAPEPVEFDAQGNVISQHNYISHTLSDKQKGRKANVQGFPNYWYNNLATPDQKAKFKEPPRSLRLPALYKISGDANTPVILKAREAMAFEPVKDTITVRRIYKWARKNRAESDGVTYLIFRGSKRRIQRLYLSENVHVARIQLALMVVRKKTSQSAQCASIPDQEGDCPSGEIDFRTQKGSICCRKIESKPVAVAKGRRSKRRARK